LENKETVDWNDLLAKAKSGVPGADDQLCKELEVRLRSVIQYRLWGWSKEDLDDIIQNTLVVFCEKINQIDSNPHYFALNIMRNKVGDALRSHKSGREVSLEPGEANDGLSGIPTPIETISDDDERSDFTQEIENKELNEKIRLAIKKMSTFCKTFFLAVLEDQPISEIWDCFRQAERDLSRSTFDKRIFDCRKRLRFLLKGVV
jgi:DNA-directed RNA polymerase specialized sigma24 family protein